MQKFIVIALAILLSLNISPAFAHSEKFAGPAIAAGIAAVGSNATYRYRGNLGESEHSLGNNQFIALVNASYLKDVSEKWLIGGGATYDLNPTTSGSSGIGSIGYGNTNKNKNHFSIYVQPTYALNEATALFFKVGYNQTKVNVNDNGQLYTIHYNRTMNGLGLGVGAMVFLNQNVFAKFEIEYVNYRQEQISASDGSYSVDYGLNTTAGILSVGYRF